MFHCEASVYILWLKVDYFSSVTDDLITMYNYLKKLNVNFIVSTLLIFTLMGCTTASKKVDGMKVYNLQEPTFIHLKGLQGLETLSRIYSKTVIKEKTGDVIKEKEVKEVDFDVSSEVLLVDRGKAHIYFLITTVRKDGDVELADLAMPELNEKLKVTMYPNAEVFEVADKPKTSIYYVPPISLPLHKVKVGSQWAFKRMWLTAKNNVPVQIEMQSKLTNILECATNDKCADIELQGKVSLPTADPEKIQLTSDIKGRILFSLRTGSIVWSSVYTHEEITFEKKTQIIKTCTTNHLVKPKLPGLTLDDKEKCDPLTETPKMTWVPAI